ncbi:chaplin [Streptomyces sp. NPDC048483]|uniref:chaplin n=1 Tax=Streptomyces sp. NPDC048483 TaxID=3154927 RepID=UPI00343DB95D
MRQVARKGLITMAAAGGVLAAVSGYAHADSGAEGGAAHSPGVASGNNVQVPVDAPVNVCGNTVDVVGLLNPAFGNRCANGGKHRGGHREHGGQGHQQDQHRGGSGRHAGGASAEGGAAHSPGVASGNNVQVPVDVPVNVCGNSVSIVGLVNPAVGNECGNEARPHTPTGPHHPHHPQQPGHHPHHPRPEQPSEPGHPHGPGSKGGPETTPPEHQRGPDDLGTTEIPGMRPQAEPQGKAAIVTTPSAGEHLAQTGAGMIGYAVPASAGLLLGGAVLYRRARTARR